MFMYNIIHCRFHCLHAELKLLYSIEQIHAASFHQNEEEEQERKTAPATTTATFKLDYNTIFARRQFPFDAFRTHTHTHMYMYILMLAFICINSWVHILNEVSPMLSVYAIV